MTKYYNFRTIIVTRKNIYPKSFNKVEFKDTIRQRNDILSSIIYKAY